jgi:hypothetical protein
MAARPELVLVTAAAAELSHAGMPPLLPPLCPPPLLPGGAHFLTFLAERVKAQVWFW